MRAQDRRAAVQTARQKLALRPVYLDTETTGRDPGDQIVEICILEHDGAALVDSLVQARASISAEAGRLHGLTSAALQDAPTWAALWPRVERALAGRVIAIYNADFDLRLMRQSHRAAGLPWREPGAEVFCVMKLYAQFYGEWNHRTRSYRWQSLEDARWQCGIDLLNAHRARADALLARAVLRHMAEDQSAGG
jgi:DNA polymerase-3 subunit epsilon